MTTLTLSKFSFSLLAVWSCAGLKAEDRIEFRTVSGWTEWAPAEEALRPDIAFLASQREFAQGVFDPAAGDLLRAAASFTRRLFKLPTLRFQRAVTYKNSAGDHLVSEWDFQEPFAAGTLTLRDTPYESEYSLKLNGLPHATRQQLSGLLNTLVAWSTSPFQSNIPGLIVDLPSSYPLVPAFRGRPPRALSQVEYLYAFSLDGWGPGADLYLRVFIGKGLMARFDPVQSWVPERFPPLTELVKSWSDAKISGEIGRPSDPSVKGDFSEYRDSILITELARRGLPLEACIQLLTDVPAQPVPRSRLYSSAGILQSRAGIVFQAYLNAGRGSDLKNYLLPIVNAYERIGPSASDAVTEVFRVLLRAKSCEQRFEVAAVSLLKKGSFHEGALSYLGECSNSNDVLQTVESTPVPQNLAQVKQVTAARIRARATKH